MARRFPLRTALLAACAAFGLGGCGHGTPTESFPFSTEPAVFHDAYLPGVGFNPFQGSKADAVALDSTTKYQGVASLRVTVPGPGDPGVYAGGAIVAPTPRNLSGYNALSFWIRASRAVTLDVIGFGNDNTGTSQYEGRRTNVSMTTGWTHVLIPIPLPARLDHEKGLLFFAEGPQGGAGLTFWLDEVEFVNVTPAAPPRPVLATQSVSAWAGTQLNLQGLTRTVFNLGGADTAVTVQHMPGYFTFASSNSAVALVDGVRVLVRGAGSATVTAKLGATDAAGAITVVALAPPATPAPTPTVPAADVISLFSDAYTNVPVDTWSASWDQADVADLAISGNATKVFTNLVYSGTEFAGAHAVDATAMTAFHLDIWVPSGTVFKVKLVDYGSDAAYGGTGTAADSQSELTFDATSTPALATGQWLALDIPLSSFTGLASRAHLAQLILSGDTRTVFLDNVYFHR